MSEGPPKFGYQPAERPRDLTPEEIAEADDGLEEGVEIERLEGLSDEDLEQEKDASNTLRKERESEVQKFGSRREVLAGNIRREVEAARSKMKPSFQDESPNRELQLLNDADRMGDADLVNMFKNHDAHPITAPIGELFSPALLEEVKTFHDESDSVINSRNEIRDKDRLIGAELQRRRVAKIESERRST